MEPVSLSDGRRIFGADMLGAEEVSAGLGLDPFASAAGEERRALAGLPFDAETLMRAADDGMMLVLRVAHGDRPLTILALADRFPGPAELGKSYRESWFAAEPFATTETCKLGWSLIDKQPFAASRNCSYGEQDAALAARSQHMGLGLRRRTAIEIVYDTLLYAAARNQRLLESEWDWSLSASIDGGLVSAGQFDERGLRLLAYSRAVRFDSLGLCATVDGT